GKSLRPSVQVNGQALPVKGDIIRGYDQHNRNQFFGLLEIPVPLDMLNAGSNQVKLQFGDSGGHISSAILQVQNATESVPLSVTFPKDHAITIYPNPVHDYLQIKGLAPKAEVSIYDLRGRLIQAGLSTETGVDVRVLPVGTYLLRFEQGAIKFVKE
ncbi:MAG: T9SS type A sorting domain-containing protein, partial [Bacteroidota bacterium]